MAGGFNRVTLIGNLGDEPQVRPSQSGTSVATITLAINEYRRDQNGNKTESTEWVRVVAFGKNAEWRYWYLGLSGCFFFGSFTKYKLVESYIKYFAHLY